MDDTFAGTPFEVPSCICANFAIDVAFGSEVTIRHVNTQGGYLHSHPHTYPGGSKRKLVLSYTSQHVLTDLSRATGDAVSSP